MELKPFVISLIFTLLFCLIQNNSFSEDYQHPTYKFFIASTENKEIHLCFKLLTGKKKIKIRFREHTDNVIHLLWSKRHEIISGSKEEVIRWHYKVSNEEVEILEFIKL